MYGTGGGVAGGAIAGGVLAYTGSTIPVFAIVLAAVVIAIGCLLLVRSRVIDARTHGRTAR